MEDMINQVLLMEKTEGICADNLRDLLKKLSEQDKEQNKTP
ncbi:MULTISPECIES: hypothetical protein [Bacillus cereus group]|uniref:Uncharacterized protein n=1 Tax=Bacillus cereus TaxID=1396 RepID=A0AAW7NFG0_BACCE|nr:MULTISPECIES: hypothetical protein [Bacillus cereus group]MDN4873654.1 hypothetical protein [Bacillus cereus]